MTTNTGILYVVATPIGNLEDITLRALNILKSVDLIASEDTRITQKLLNKYNIKSKLFSFHNFNENEYSKTLLSDLQEGKKIALVAGAGTPTISDPGYPIISLAKENNIIVIPIPGPCAAITAACASGLSLNNFTFLGFLPRKKNAMLSAIYKYKNLNTTLIIYESPKRLKNTLEILIESFGNRPATLARELTKIYEEIKTADLSTLLNHIKENPPKGEIVILIEGAKNIKKCETDLRSRKGLISALANEFSLSKKDVYKLLANLKNERK